MSRELRQGVRAGFLDSVSPSVGARNLQGHFWGKHLCVKTRCLHSALYCNIIVTTVRM